MARRPVSIRIDELLEAGIAVFTAKGYKGARLEDVAAVLDVSAPALYNYVEGKEALFDLVVQRATFPNVEFEFGKLPVASPSPGRTLAFIAAFAEQKAALPALEAALAKRGRVANPAAELREILSELFDTLAFFRRGIRLVEKCAEEWPELQTAWFAGGRRQFHEALEKYCSRRQAKGLLWKGVPSAHAAKLMIETCAMLAIHRHADPDGTPMTDTEARALAIETMVRAFVT